MVPLTPTQLDEIWHDIYNVKARFAHLPFCNLQKAGSHRFGTLRLWPKLKSLKAGVDPWDLIKWRPLASYFLHRLSKLFRIGAKWCNFVTFTFKEGFATPNPRYVVESILSFNEKFGSGRGRDLPGNSLQRYLYDIKEFFTWVPRDELCTAVEYYVNLIALKFGVALQCF